MKNDLFCLEVKNSNINSFWNIALFRPLLFRVSQLLGKLEIYKKKRSSLESQKLQYSPFLKNADDVLSSFKKTNKSD